MMSRMRDVRTRRQQFDRLRRELADIWIALSFDEARAIYKSHGADTLERVLRILVLSKISPMSMVVIRAVRIICKEQRFAELAQRPDADIAAAICSIKNLDLEARRFASETGQGRDRACAVLIENAATQPVAA